MKLLTRLRELRIENAINSFDQFHFPSDSYHHDTIGIGTTTYDDILRLNQESCNIEAHHHNQNIELA
jgi:hypothetical protein